MQALDALHRVGRTRGVDALLVLRSMAKLDWGPGGQPSRGGFGSGEEVHIAAVSAVQIVFGV